MKIVPLARKGISTETKQKHVTRKGKGQQHSGESGALSSHWACAAKKMRKRKGRALQRSGCKIQKGPKKENGKAGQGFLWGREKEKA